MLTGKLVLVLLLLVSSLCPEVNGFEPVSGFAVVTAGLASLAFSGYQFVKCRIAECCHERWIINNSTGLRYDIERKLYGQHLVISAVMKHIKAHVNPNNSPSKALALSFHGWMGTGKNYVAKIIAENLYKKGMNSEYVHLISATREFPHDDRYHHYVDKLQALIESSVKKCPQSLFIFDELEKVPGGLIDIIKPYLQPYDHLRGTDYRKAIFLFLSNSAGDEIAQYTHEQWMKQRDREEIQLKDMELLIEQSAIKTENKHGLWNSELISRQLVTAFVPFLPMDRTHVRQCVIDSIIEKGYAWRREDIREGDIVKVMELLHFQPESEQMYSTSGCKRVGEKVIYVFET